MGHLTLEQTLREHAFTQGLSEAQIARLALLATMVSFTEDQVILEERHQSQYFYLVTEGSVTIELHAASFKVSVLAVGPGEAFGWTALLDREAAVFQVRARERTRALRFSGAVLTALCKDDPDLGVEILLRALHVSAGRIRATEASFAEICGVARRPRISATRGG